MRYPHELKWKRTVFLAAFVIASSLNSNRASALERLYTIDAEQSSIAISGSVMTSVGTSQLQEQGAGSLTTNYSGTIRTDRGNNTIQFLAGSSIDAAVSGNWQPLPTGASGAAAADYGGRVSFLLGFVVINFAAREFLGDLSSGVLPLNANGDFSLNTTTVEFLSGSLSYRSTTGDFGAESVAGLSGSMSGNGSITTETRTEGVFEVLSIPIDSSFMIPIEDDTTVNLRLSGELLATAMLQTNPPGDFNRDGSVDAADFVVWRNGLGTTYTQADYEVWRANFGSGVNSAAPTNSTVPEPHALVLVLCGLCGTGWLAMR
jgi:hypothetical protein